MSSPIPLTRADAPACRADAGVTGFAVLCWVQGVYYLVTGVWPLVSIETFQAVTGPKTDHLATGREADHWLVNTVGVLVTAVAVGLLVAGWRRRPTPEVVALGLAAAVALAGIDVVYVARGVIPPVYLADAAVEAVLIAGWVWVAATPAAGRSPPAPG
ncbi:MAG: hypothetical protein U0871_22895 [Gemmataceae bacterium]